MIDRQGETKTVDPLVIPAEDPTGPNCGIVTCALFNGPGYKNDSSEAPDGCGISWF